MTFTTIEIFNGIFSLLFVIISFMIGIIIISRYFESKQKLLVYVGLSWIFLSELWWPSSLSVIMGILTGEGISLELYLFVGVFFVPIVIIFWLSAFTELLYRDKKKLIIGIFIIEAILFESYFLYFLFTNPVELGHLQSHVNMKYGTVVLIYLISHLIIMLITGVLFGRESLKSDHPEIKLKGRFLIIAFILFTFGAAIDAIFPIGFIVSRIILIASSICFYNGFILPEWIKKLFLK
ncbi:MAG: hypothetical protein ACTSR8_14300 [Promethearchaeota archaeon]